MALFDFKKFFKDNSENYKKESKEADEYYQEQKKFNEQQPKAEADAQKLQALMDGGGGSFADGDFDNSEFTGGTYEEIVWNFFQGKGFTKKCTAGIMGNMQRESFLNPTTLQNNGVGPGTGLIQWENKGSPTSDRWGELLTWAKKEGKDEWSIETQLEYVWIEFHTAYHAGLFRKYLKQFGYKPGGSTEETLKSFAAVDNISDSVKIFELTIERAKTKAYAERIASAEGFLKKYKDYTGGAQGDGKSRGNFIKASEGGLTSPYGMRNHPVRGGRAMHTGIDLRSNAGLDIKAIDGGVVTKAIIGPTGYGNYIVLDHGNKGNLKMGSLYAHLQKLNVKLGDKVSQGQVIGIMGTTGTSTGVHLHLEIHVHGKHVDPQKYTKYS